MCLAGAAGCRNAPEQANAVQPLVQTVRHEGIELVMTIDSPLVRLDHDVWLTLNVSSPTNVNVVVPQLDDRLSGLSVARRFERDTEVVDGRKIWELYIWLAPQLAPEYRIAPFAVSYSVQGSETQAWFPSQPIVLSAAPVLDGALPSGFAPMVGPRWIRPTSRALLLLCLAAAGFVALGVAVWYLGRRINRNIKLRRLSPRERALRELDELLARDLPGRARIKEFYLEITRIVRHYIERNHNVRAPEQTTEEFLEAALRNVRFDAESINKLREFLSSADLVKFAAFVPAPAVVTSTFENARNYIVTDSDRHAVALGSAQATEAHAGMMERVANGNVV